MGQVLHGSATTTEAVRRAIQLRQESVRALAKRYGVSPTTVQKWRKRSTTADARMGPKEVRSTVLTREEEAIVVAFRRHTLLALHDCLYGLRQRALARYAPRRRLGRAAGARRAFSRPPVASRGRAISPRDFRHLCAACRDRPGPRRASAAAARDRRRAPLCRARRARRRPPRSGSVADEQRLGQSRARPLAPPSPRR